METVWRVLTRRKVINPAASEDTRLSRILSVYDLTALGVGSTLGVGVYVLAGQIAKETAGPSVVLSFLIAAIASVFAGLCYAEFGARVPRAGSAYIYSYVCVGEFIAYVIGWNLILEYVIGSASVARTLSLYVDTLVNNSMKDAFIDVAPIDVAYMSRYFDFFAFSITVLLTLSLAFGMKESKWVNNILTVLNVGVVLFVIIAGSIKTDTANWHVLPNATHNNDTNIGEGGFFPFGVDGMIKGAATCFYGFVGFDCIATTGEEVKNPKRAIPISIIASLLIIFLAYFGTSVVVTLMVPYYLQDHDAPIPHAFEVVGWEFAKWIVSIGGIFGLAASLFGAMFPLPRIIYAMASDRLIFHFLGQVSEQFRTPVVGTLLAGLLTGLMAALFELKQLIDMMSIGTLLAYTIVAASVLLLRYARDEKSVYEIIPTVSDSDENDCGYTSNRSINDTDDNLIDDDSEYEETYSMKNILGQVFNYKRHKNPSRLSQIIVGTDIFLYCIMCLFIGLCAKYLKTPLSNGENWAIGLTATVVCLAAILIISVATQPISQTQLNFKVPFIPFIPALSILINIYLMLMLDSLTWIRFGVWMLIGLPLYYLSVNSQPQAHNRSINTNLDKISDNNNVYDNKSYVNTENSENSDDVDAMNTVLKQLDDVLEEEDLKIESNTYDNYDLNVVADVHCVDECSVKNVSPNADANDEETASFYNVVDENESYCEAYVPPPPPLPPGGLPPVPSYNDISHDHIYHELSNPEAVSSSKYVGIGFKPTDDELASVVLRKTNRDDKKIDTVTETELPDGHIDFNSEQYKIFREQLEDVLQLQPNLLVPIRDRGQHTDRITEEMKELIKENVDSSSIDVEHVKNVLNAHLEKSNPTKDVDIITNSRTANNNTQIEINKDKETHSNLMKNVFETIKSRNGDDD